MSSRSPQPRPSRRAELESLFRERIVVIDGAMGTCIQTHELTEAQFRGERFRDHPTPLQNDNDLLVLTQPDLIRDIHRDYLRAGADIVETNTFNSNSISQADYGLAHLVYELNFEAARLAREAADAHTAETGRPAFVAGSIGPTSRTCSMSQDVSDPAKRGVTFEQLRETYMEQCRGLLDGGADLFLPETVIDTLNLKAALFAIAQLKEERGVDTPVIASITFVQEGNERTLSGQTLGAVWTSIENHDLLAVTINCALGAREMRPRVQELSRTVPLWTGCYPNAGLPNEFGGFDERPADTARLLSEFAREGWINLAGGCCGTTPEHVRAIAQAVAGIPPRPVPRIPPRSSYSGLDVYTILPDSNFTMIGERTNVAGSRQFLRLIKAGGFEQAVEVARQQVEGGANLLDVNMDEALLDGPASMTRFLNQIAAEPDVAKIPVMVDSSDWAVLEAGLRCLQGKGVVNSISLKDGEQAFLDKARLIRRYGAAAVVMGFDEQGQAATIEHKVAIAERAYKLLTERVGFAPEDIIYDANIFPVATGIAEHDDYGRAFIEAVREIKRRLPGIRTSGGVSNVSFSYRGNDLVREAMHAVFLYHAIQAGLDMAIVNAGQLAVVDELDKELRERVEDVILNRRADATQRLTEHAERVQGKGKERAEDLAWRETTLEKRLEHSLLHGILKHLDEDVAEALATFPTPLSIIEGPLMAGMGVVGDLFGAGKMFLPQVVKSARVMQKAVAILEPHMDRASAGTRARGKVLLATVKGDVHDIGKNIVGVVLGCNGYDVVDLGVMVPTSQILERARKDGVDMVGLSGLITPSLHEMVHVAREMSREGFRCPLLIGGATTSRRHTAVKIAPHYPGTVHVLDASRAVEVVSDLLDPERREPFLAQNRAEQEEARVAFASGEGARPLLSLAEARARGLRLAWRAEDLPRPERLGVVRLAPALRDVARCIDWTPFFHTWELKGTYPSILDKPEVGPRARELKADADALLEEALAAGWLEGRAVYGLFPAWSEGDDIVLAPPGGDPVRMPMLRQQQGKETREADGSARAQVCLSDYVAPRKTGLADHVGAFAVAVHGAEEAARRFRTDHDEYRAILIQSLADRLAEAMAEWLHEQVRGVWGYERPGTLSTDELIRERYRGIRPAPGYPATPDHLTKRPLFALLGAEDAIGARLTESLAMSPPSAVCGLYLAHPEASYFAVGKLGRDQVEDYARRMGIDLLEAERWLAPNLGYDDDR